MCASCHFIRSTVFFKLNAGILSLLICKQFIGYEFLYFIPIYMYWPDFNNRSEENQVSLYYKQSTESEPLDINFF